MLADGVSGAMRARIVSGTGPTETLDDRSTAIIVPPPGRNTICRTPGIRWPQSTRQPSSRSTSIHSTESSEGANLGVNELGIWRQPGAPSDCAKVEIDGCLDLKIILAEMKIIISSKPALLDKSYGIPLKNPCLSGF